MAKWVERVEHSPDNVRLLVSAIVRRLPSDRRRISGRVDLYVNRSVRSGRVDKKKERTDQCGDLVAQHALVTAVIFLLQSFDSQVPAMNQGSISWKLLIVRLIQKKNETRDGLSEQAQLTRHESQVDCESKNAQKNKTIYTI